MKVAILIRVSSKSDRQDHDRQICDLIAIAQKNEREIREMYEYLMGEGISIHTVARMDTGGRGAFPKAINNIIVTILAEIAELETVRLSQRIKPGMDEARQKGKVIGGPKGTTGDIGERLKTNPKYRRAAKALRDGPSLRKTAAVNTAMKIRLSTESAG